MRGVVVRGLAAGSLVMSALAVAPPALANCDHTQRVPPRTIGVAGEPVATTPDIRLGWCGSTGSGVPMPRVEEGCCGTGDFAVFVDFPARPVGLTWTFGVTIDDTYQEVVIPAEPAAGGSSLCVFFHGVAVENPGGCLAFIER